MYLPVKMDRKSWKRRLQLRTSTSSASFLVPKLGSLQFRLNNNNNNYNNNNNNNKTTIMGNTPIQKAVAKPLRPFDQVVGRKATGAFSSKKKHTPSSILVQLIARRDWQKVLIRASLFPGEINQEQTLLWYGIEWTGVLPLHLACALQPPASVITKLLSATTTTTSSVLATTNMVQKKRSQKNSKKRLMFRKTKKAALLQESHTSEDDSSDDNDDDNDGAGGDVAQHLAFVNDADCLLPLHLACLYRASSAVLSVLLQAHPEGAQVHSINNMLPIHIVSKATIDIPPPIRSPADFECLTPHQTPTVADSLLHLITVYPESLTMSDASGRTPLDYIQTTMEDGTEKTACLNILQDDDDDCMQDDDDDCMQDVESILTEEESMEHMVEQPVEDLHDEESILTEESTRLVPLEIVCNEEPSVVTEYKQAALPQQSQVLSKNPLYAFMASQQWEAACDMVEDQPERCHQWQYGIDSSKNGGESQLWKRLPIHHACRFGAPMHLFTLLLSHNPNVPADPYTGALPLHLICRHAPRLETVHVLLAVDPSSLRETDHSGRLPIHYACLHHYAEQIISILIKAYPGSVAVKDKDGKTPYEYCDTHKMDTDLLQKMKKLQQFLQKVEERKIMDENKEFTKPTSPLGLEISTTDKSKEEKLILEVDTNPEALMLLP